MAALAMCRWLLALAGLLVMAARLLPLLLVTLLLVLVDPLRCEPERVWLAVVRCRSLQETLPREQAARLL